MSTICHWINNDNQTTEFTVTLLKPLNECTTEDLTRCIIAKSYDQLNNVVYVGTTPQQATENSADTVWFNTSNNIDFSTLHFSSISTNKIPRATIILAVPQYTEINTITKQDIDNTIYLVSNIQQIYKTILVNSVKYRNDYLRTQVNLSKPLKHCLNESVFNYAKAASLITDGNVIYQLIPVFMYKIHDKVFITRNEPYSLSVIDTLNEICGFTEGIPCFDEPNRKLCLGVNINDRHSAVPIVSGYYNNIIESLYGDMLNIYSCSSTVNADIKFSVYSEQSSSTRLQLQRGLLFNEACYTACASAYGFVFINDITNEIYEPVVEDGVVKSCKKIVESTISVNNASTKQKKSAKPDTAISNTEYSVGIQNNNRWQVVRHTEDADTIIEDFGPKAVISGAYLSNDKLPWLLVIRASDKHMYIKRVEALMNTAILVDSNVENATVYNTDSYLLIAYSTNSGVFVKHYYIINNGLIENTSNQLSENAVDELEIKLIDNQIYINSYVNNKLSKSWLLSAE